MQSMLGVLGTLALPTARAGTSYEMKRQKTRSTSSPFLISSIPNFYTRKGRPHGHRYGKEEGDKEYHTANQLQKKCRKRGYSNIHDRFIRDTWLRKTMLELGRTEEVIREMDRLANEDHTHIATEEELNVYRGNWWIRSNFVGSDTMPIRHGPDFKQALSTLHRLKKAEDMKLITKIGGKALPHRGGNGKIPGGIPHLRHGDGLDTDRTVKPAKISEWSVYLWTSQ